MRLSIFFHTNTPYNRYCNQNGTVAVRQVLLKFGLVFIAVSIANENAFLLLRHAAKYKAIKPQIMFPQESLIVRKSKLPGAGKGLFTKQFIEKGTLIVEYKGEITTWKAINDNERFNAYVFYINKNHVIDAKEDLKAIGRYANDASGLSKVRGIVNNAEYAVKNKKVFIKATADIEAGQEILVAYGKEYWDVIKHNQSIEAKFKKEKTKKRA
ncbi:MAG: SET domain-containing protein-lysine N-methyltransferase [Chitinophagaceae bacterium]